MDSLYSLTYLMSAPISTITKVRIIIGGMAIIVGLWPTIGPFQDRKMSPVKMAACWTLGAILIGGGVACMLVNPENDNTTEDSKFIYIEGRVYSYIQKLFLTFGILFVGVLSLVVGTYAIHKRMRSQ